MSGLHRSVDIMCSSQWVACAVSFSFISFTCSASGWLMQTPLGLFVLASGWLARSQWVADVDSIGFICYSQWVVYTDSIGVICSLL